MLSKLMFRRTSAATIWIQVAVLILAMLAPSLILSSRADAYTGAYMPNRVVTMETSEAGATNVIYHVSFDLATAHTAAGIGALDSITIQACQSTPIIGDSSCTAVSGFDWNGADIYNEVGITASSIDAANSTTSELNIDVDVPGDVAASTTVSFDIGNNTTGVTNPSTTNATFYLRILTWVDEATANSYTPGTTTAAVDVGGIALSTANTITVTAKVQETLTFCVYTGVNCAAGGSAVAIGDATNGVIGTADTPANTDTSIDIATNATSGAKVYMSGTLLKSGANDINSIGNTCTAEVAGTESFGMRIDEGANSNFLPDPAYNCVANSYAFDTTAMDPTSTTTPFGDEILNTSTGPTDSETVTMEFDGNASNLTPAGIYTATYDLVAAATF